MKLNGLTASKLFRAMGKSSLNSYGQLQAFKEGRNEPNIDCIRDLAKYFNLTIEQFCYVDLKN